MTVAERKLAADLSAHERQSKEFVRLARRLGPIRRIRAATSPLGTYTWMFDTPFRAGIVPVIICLVESSFAGEMSTAHVTAVSETSAMIQVNRMVLTTVGVPPDDVDVWGPAVSNEAFVHLAALAP